MNNFKGFLTEYRGAIIGAIIAILIIVTGLDRLILAVAVICICALLGNYVQRNKQDVKEKLKNFIDRM